MRLMMAMRWNDQIGRMSEKIVVSCYACGQPVKYLEAIMDLDGPAFRAYYHWACVPKEEKQP